MACPVKTEIQYSGPSVSSGRSKLFGYLLVIITLVAIPADAPGQSVQDVVTDLTVIADGGVRKKFVSPAANSGGLQMPKGPLLSRLHVTPKKPVSEIRIYKPQIKQIKEAKKIPEQPVVTPGPPPKVQVEQVPTQKPTPLAKIEENAPTPTKPEAPPPAPAEPTITSEPSQNASTEITLKPGQALNVAFEGLATNLPPNARAKLSDLANAMRDTKEYRVQLMAYAGGKGLLTSKVRRISLSRALAVRSFLIEKGIRSTQIDVRALGNKTSEKPVNRVDINLVQR